MNYYLYINEAISEARAMPVTSIGRGEALTLCLDSLNVIKDYCDARRPHGDVRWVDERCCSVWMALRAGNAHVAMLEAMGIRFTLAEQANDSGEAWVR